MCHQIQAMCVPLWIRRLHQSACMHPAEQSSNFESCWQWSGHVHVPCTRDQRGLLTDLERNVAHLLICFILLDLQQLSRYKSSRCQFRPMSHSDSLNTSKINKNKKMTKAHKTIDFICFHHKTGSTLILQQQQRKEEKEKEKITSSRYQQNTQANRLI